MISLDAVLKIGGSLERASNLETLCREISRLGKRYRLLVVPGGGEFADQVRKSCQRYTLEDTAAHRMALLAMDQYGYLLNQLIGDSVLIADTSQIRNAVEARRVVVFLPSSMVNKADPLPHSWQVTSDTIAAWLAQTVGCRRLVLLKDVDGLLSVEKDGGISTELITNLTVDQLAGLAGGVDGYLAHFLASVQLETWIINGLYPERLSDLLGAGYTVGTHVEPS